MEAPRCAGRAADPADYVPNPDYDHSLASGSTVRHARSQGYSVGMTVSVANVMAPFEETQAEIRAGIAGAYVALAVLVSLGLLAVLAVATALTNSVVGPVKRLLATVQRLNRRDFSVQFDKGA